MLAADPAGRDPHPGRTTPRRDNAEGRGSSDPPLNSRSKRDETTAVAEAKPLRLVRDASRSPPGSLFFAYNATLAADPAGRDPHPGRTTPRRDNAEGRGSSDPPRNSRSKRDETTAVAEAKPLRLVRDASRSPPGSLFLAYNAILAADPAGRDPHPGAQVR